VEKHMYHKATIANIAAENATTKQLIKEG